MYIAPIKKRLLNQRKQRNWMMARLDGSKLNVFLPPLHSVKIKRLGRNNSEKRLWKKKINDRNQ